MSVIKISRAALARNLERLREKTGVEICAVLKCNGYGMGLVPYANILSELGCGVFAVSRPEEALELRSSGFEPSLILLTPVWDAELITRLSGADVILTAGGARHFEFMKDALRDCGHGARVHIAVDSGMRRCGFTLEELNSLEPDAELISIEGVFTHFYAPASKEITARQHEYFMQAVDTLQTRGINPGIIHCCASHAALAYPEYHHDMIRLGSALVGTPDGLERIWRFETEAMSVKHLKKGSPLGYGGWRVGRELSAASLCIGFSDGVMLERFEPVGFGGAFRRFARDILRPSCPIKVFYNGRQLPVLGGAGTTHISVDVTGTDAREGDTFTIESNPMFLSPSLRREYVEDFD